MTGTRPWLPKNGDGYKNVYCCQKVRLTSVDIS